MIKVFCFSNLEKFGLTKKEISRVKNECNKAKKDKGKLVSVVIEKLPMYEYRLGELKFFDSWEDKPKDITAIPVENFMKD